MCKFIYYLKTNQKESYKNTNHDLANPPGLEMCVTKDNKLKKQFENYTHLFH